MKLVRYGPPGEEQPGVWLDDMAQGNKPAILNVRAMTFDIEDYNTHFFEHHGPERLANLLKESARKIIPAEGIRLGVPFAKPSKIICIGKNYAEHAREFDAAIPENPILFSKAVSAMTGPFDAIKLPREATMVDTEVELAVIIGQKACKVTRDEALTAVAGYTVLNDITNRQAQKNDGQWFRGKNADTFCPLGPFFVTKDEIIEPQRLHLVSKINGRVLQDSDTSKMIFDIATLISFISASITLLPGDVIATGTPAGIGSKKTPPVCLKHGDLVETIIDNLGHQINKVEAA